ncbi:replication initiation and membrane attachment family protein [Tuberibacillus sp. Marseille-P3662]|uniref:replication initiation and membrane attachment family protein n=1 Tax=Tuberibacillus sp. Marseille-P3662 TaxID=1965358 RepID=UPI000A1CCE79|nr:DnaD domain protein [Tuberibacillus sp. Marseille-P3662]
MHWKDLLPVDAYHVQSDGMIGEYELRTLYFLYQPLIGMRACALYTTLWQEVTMAHHLPEATHHHLMTMMDVDLKVLLSERQQLEAVGLLRVYQTESGSTRTFIYELVAPLTPAAFFTDGLLGHYLYNKLGEREFRRIEQTFLPEHHVDTHQYTNLTASFEQVFQSVSPSELQAPEASERFEQADWPDKSLADRVTNFEFDFEALYQHLSDVIISREAFTAEVKEAITKLAWIYMLEPEEMSGIIQKAFLHSGSIDIETLQREVRYYYKLETGEALPVLSQRRQPPDLRHMDDKQPQTEEEKQVKTLEQVSPHELLEYLSGGGKPPAADLKVVEEIMMEQKLPAGVVNVLIHYVMIANDRKLSKSYVEKIAGHWARKHIQSVPQAMSLARSEHQKYQQWRQGKKQGQGQSYRKNQRQAPVPKWMKEDNNTQQPTQDQNNNAKQRAEWLEQYLNNL